MTVVGQLLFFDMEIPQLDPVASGVRNIPIGVRVVNKRQNIPRPGLVLKYLVTGPDYEQGGDESFGLQGGEDKKLTVNVPPGAPGDYTIRAGIYQPPLPRPRISRDMTFKVV